MEDKESDNPVNSVAKRTFTEDAYDIVVDYSGYSTLAGLIYVFMPNQPFIGKVKPSYPNQYFTCVFDESFQ